MGEKYILFWFSRGFFLINKNFCEHLSDEWLSAHCDPVRHPVPDEIQRFMEEVKSLGYQDKPPYEKLRAILQNGLKAIRAKDDNQLEFSPVRGAPAPAVKVRTHQHTETVRVQLRVQLSISKRISLKSGVT